MNHPPAVRSSCEAQTYQCERDDVRQKQEHDTTTGPNTFVLKAIDAPGNVSASNPGDIAAVLPRAIWGAAAMSAPDFASTITSAYSSPNVNLR
jgi:hypothetical protein